MKKIFLSLGLFVFIDANSQTNDSLLKIMEKQRLTNEAVEGRITGKVLPGFSAKDMKGKIHTGNTVRNAKATFLNFWYVSCAPCIAEIPNLNRLYDITKDNPDVQFFAVTWETETRVKEAVEKYGIRFPVLLTSPKDIRQLTFAKGYPVNMVLDKKGRVYSFLSGGRRNPGPEFELYWNREIEKIVRGDTLTESQPVQIPENIPSINFIDSSKFQSLEALVEYFQGQPVYIDLWASWCLPCREELKSRSNAVDSFLYKYKIVRLYLSIDNPQGGEIWKSLVYEFRPAGYHLLAGSELYKDVKLRVYKNGSTIDVPRYIIVKNGKIVELNAFRPSDGQKLLNQLSEKLLQ